jgi:general secretion pathway protein E
MSHSVSMSEVSMLSLEKILLKNGVLQDSDLERAQAAVKNYGGQLENVLLGQGACSEEDILAANAELFGIKTYQQWLAENSLRSVTEVTNNYDLEKKWWEEQQAFPLAEIDDVIWIATADVTDNFVQTVLARKTGKSVESVIIVSHELRQLIGLFEDADQHPSQAADAQSLRDLATGAPIIHFVNDIIQRAVDAKASDIHFESYRGVFRVRIRVDGVMHEIDRPGVGMQAAIVSRLKLMANLDISEKRLPQDGRIRTRVSGRDLDIRVATTPGVAGESLVLRLLDSVDGVSSLAELDMFEDHIETTRKLLASSSGIIIVTGPTGSGKTTSLYAFLNELIGDERKIITVEDPVEYQTPGITQIQVHSEIGLTFASILRSVLRQDPDIILVGEIRDRETAETAVQAALTGHLVLATLHTNDAASAFVRLMDMGVESYLLATSVIGVMAQRLVRKSCVHCKHPDEAGSEQAAALGFVDPGQKWPDLSVHENYARSEGCPECMGTGFAGRRSIFEMFAVDETMRHIISTKPDQLSAYLAESEFRSLKEDGMLRAAAGDTTISEVIRVAG